MRLATLRLDDLKLHGREGDLKLLKAKLGDIQNANGELIMVAGSSGCGKSALVSRGLRDPAKKRGIAFAAGKFDQNLAAPPYSAFSHALSDLAKHVIAKEDAGKVKSDIKKALGEDGMQLISRAMPGACELLFSLQNRAPRRSSVSGGGGGKEVANRMQYAIRELMKAICANAKKGVILFIDDLQWADAASLELLQSLLQDADIPSLLLAGAYRDDEVPETHPLALQIREAERLGSTITTIKVGNLERGTVTSLVAEVLRMEDKEGAVESLAAIVHQKTEGNAFFILVFLTSLYEDGLLEYNLGIMRWMWDDEKVKQKLVTENVANILVNKLKSFRDVFQNVMKVKNPFFLGIYVVFELGKMSDLLQCMLGRIVSRSILFDKDPVDGG